MQWLKAERLRAQDRAEIVTSNELDIPHVGAALAANLLWFEVIAKESFKDSAFKSKSGSSSLQRMSSG